PTSCVTRLTALIAADAGFRAASQSVRQQEEGPPRRLFWVAPAMSPSPWPVPPLPTTTALADHLGLAPRELDWFADCLGREAEAPPGPLRHYTYRWVAGARGKRRLLEQPRPRLRPCSAAFCTM